MPHYAAKLLFQYRVDVDGDPGKRRLCEERIINFSARSPRKSLQMAKRRGKRGERSYKNSDGNTVSFEFVGIIDLMSLGVEAEAGEVWYDIRERVLPMERRSRIIPADDVLLGRLGKGAGWPKAEVDRTATTDSRDIEVLQPALQFFFFAPWHEQRSKMSNRTWTCVPCRKSYRRVQSITSVECPSCHGPCEYVHWKIRVPSPKRTKAWDEFWAKYKAEKTLLEAFHRGELRQDVTLELLNMQLYVA